MTEWWIHYVLFLPYRCQRKIHWHQIILQVLLRNSQNTLHSSSNSIRKSDTKADSTPLVNCNNNQSNQPRNQCVSTPEVAKGTYTTSIYIRSTEHAGGEMNKTVSPVLSLHRVNGIKEDNKVNVRVKREEIQVYITTAAVQRHSDISNQRSDSLRTNMNFVSISEIL